MRKCLSLCPVAASCLSHGSKSPQLMDIQLGNRWNSVPVSTLEGRSGEADIPNFFSTTLPKGKHLHPHTPSLAPSSSEDSLLWSLSLEKERAVPFGASVWNTCCLPAQWAFTPASPLREWLVATSLRAVRCQQKAHRVGTYKPNSPVSFIRNQPDILIFRFLRISVGIKLGECNFISWPLRTSEAGRIKSVGPIWYNTTYARTIFIKDKYGNSPTTTPWSCHWENILGKANGEFFFFS